MFGKLFSRRVRPQTRKPRQARPQIEPLEDRALLSTLVGLTTRNELVTFDSARPGRVLDSVPVTGLRRGEDLVGIDARPANGLIYAVSDADRLYTINLATGVATPVGGAPFAVSLTGRNFGTDFNPVVDRFRLVSDVDQNLRLNPNDGTTVDGNPTLDGAQPDTALAYAAGDRFENFDPSVVASAYTNNFAGAATTTLFGIDSRRDTLVRQGGLDVPPGTPSPNGGQLFTIGSLGIRVGSRAGFDIAPDGTAYAAFQTSGRGSGLYTIDLNSGQATLIGRIGGGKVIEGLTVLIREEVVYGVTVSNQLVRFNAADPGTILSSVPISNLMQDEDVVGLDFRPATGQLFALTSMNRVLIVNPATGQAAQFGGPLAVPLTGGSPVGFDVNPAADRLRIVNADDQNLRFNPITGVVVDFDGDPTNGIQPDGTLNYADLTDPNIVAAAYTNNDNDPVTGTVLFDIDSARNILVTQDPPNNGALNLLANGGALGVDPTDLVGFDIAGSGFAGSGGVALAAMQLEGETVSKLFTIDLNTGAATLVGTVGGGQLIRDIAIAPPSFQFDAAAYTVRERDGVALITVLRTGGSRGPATVQFATSDGSAADGPDYAGTVQTLTFADGETSKTIEIPIVRDQAREARETVNLTLSTPPGATSCWAARVPRC